MPARGRSIPIQTGTRMKPFVLTGRLLWGWALPHRAPPHQRTGVKNAKRTEEMHSGLCGHRTWQEVATGFPANVTETLVPYMFMYHSQRAVKRRAKVENTNSSVTHSVC